MKNILETLNNGWRQIALLAVLLVAMNLGIEKLTDQDVTGAEILLIRAIFNLLTVLGIAIIWKRNIIPSQPKLQFGAFMCLGSSLLLIFTAYQYISAGSVSTLQRLDIPLLVLLAIFSGTFSAKQFALAIFALGITALLIILNQTTDENPLGYFLVLSGVFVICLNTLLQKKIAVSENIETIMVVTSVSSIFWGAIRCWQAGATFENIKFPQIAIIFGLSVINFVIFYIVNDLYKKESPEFVRYPYLLAAFLTMGMEMIIEQKIFSPILLTGNVVILIILTFLVRNRQKSIVEVETH